MTMNIEKVFKVNGKEFTDEEAANAYLAEVEQKEIERKEQLRKAEEERKAKKEAVNKLSKEINEHVDKLNQLAKEYTNTTGEHLEFTCARSNGNSMLEVFRNSNDFDRFSKLFDSLLSF